MRRLGRATAILVAVLSAVAWGMGPASGASMNLHRGSQGALVRTLEMRLYKLHLLSRSQVDRHYRTPTVRAIKRFQRQMRLRPTGRVTLRTWNLVAGELQRRTTPPKPGPVAPPPAPTILGHRGARVPGITENTMTSMRYAADKADVLEFDLQLTADHEFVLMHDATLDRTTDCTGPVAAQTLAYLREHCTTDNGSGPIPTFAEVAQYAAGAGKPIAPEVKDDQVTDDELAQLVAVVDDNGLATRTFVQSFFPSVFPRLHALESRLTFVYLTGPSTAPATVRNAGATIAGVGMPGLTASEVTAFRAAGLRVWAWTASTAAQLTSLWNLRVDGVFTDIPGTARTMYHRSRVPLSP